VSRRRSLQTPQSPLPRSLRLRPTSRRC
jgi:hypothetical protein